MSEDAAYPEDAYAPDGTLWWELEYWPSKSNPTELTKQEFGQEVKLAAWLWFNKKIGDVFTLPEAKSALGPKLAKNSQHFDRRLRTLREVGWAIPSGKDGGVGIRNDEYRLDGRGVRWWVREDRAGAKRFAPSAKVRRLVFERDGRRCVICSIGAGEPYDGEPDSKARMTIGHRVPQERLRQRSEKDNIDNWQTECSRCNEPVRDVLPDPRTYEEVLVSVRNLKRQEKVELREWLEQGRRVRGEVDRVYDLARTLTIEDRERLLRTLDGFK